jgi:diacylglycerol kinase
LPLGWRARLGLAFRGLKLGIRGNSRFFVHFFFAALSLAAAIVLYCDVVEWCALLGCIGFVLTAELFNSALQTLFQSLDEPARRQSSAGRDLAAGAVLLASIVAIVIGGIIFLPKLAAFF